MVSDLARVLNTAIGGQAGKIYLVIADLGTTSGQGLDFMLGDNCDLRLM
jgi:hypothetical protein